MSERKVLNKYYPPDFDPSKVPRVKRKSKKNDVRTMAPFNMRCNSCGEYIASATKFNTKKEAVTDETYNNLTIYRFYIRCPGCLGTIIFRTNPKDAGYEIESGATENFKALKVAEKRAQEEAVAEEEEDKINPMKNLENRTKASRQQMEASEQIQNLRSIKYKYQSVDLDSIIREKRKEISDGVVTSDSVLDDDEIRSQAKEILKRRAIESTESSAQVSKAIALPKPGPSLTSSSSSSSSKLTSSLSSLKKKIKVTPKT